MQAPLTCRIDRYSGVRIDPEGLPDDSVEFCRLLKGNPRLYNGLATNLKKNHWKFGENKNVEVFG